MGYTTTAMFILKKFFVELSCATAIKLLFFWLLLGQAAAIATVVLLKFVVYYKTWESWAAEHQYTMFIFNALCVD